MMPPPPLLSLLLSFLLSLCFLCGLAAGQSTGFSDFNTWHTVEPEVEQPSPRAWHTAVAAHNSSTMLIFAGVVIDGSSDLQRAFFRCYNDLWTYHAHDSYWEPSKTVGAAAALRPGEAAPSLPPKRGSHTAVLLTVQGRDVMLVYAGFGCADTFQVRAKGKGNGTRTG